MNKGYNKKIGDVYVLPLPFVTKPLPPLFLHNPVSVAVFLYALFVKRNPTQTVHSGLIINSRSESATGDELTWPSGVKVTDPASALALWQQGFFGKGTLSRSEPSWFGRTARRLGFDGGELSLEEITEMRREKRRQFKRERELQQQRDLEQQLIREGKLAAHSAAVLAAEEPANAEVQEKEMREEDKQLIRGDTIVRMEYLHLHPCEAIFLSLGLGVLDISNLGSNFDALPLFFTNRDQWLEYVAYHYLRSLGWCVRSGIKFGVQWLVYRRGPPFQHAEFAVMVLSPGCRQTWAWLHCTMRVVGGAKKTLCLMYIEGPSELPDFTKVRTINQFRAELSKYSVKMVNYQRFTPSKHRD